MFMHKVLSIAAVLLVTILSYYVYNSDLYFVITDEIGYFPYMALTPLASIILLYFIPGRLSANLMILFCILVYTDVVCWWLTGFGYDVLEIYLQIQNIAFIVEILLMLPHRAIHGFVGAIRRYDASGVFAKAKLFAYNCTHRLPTNHE